MWDTVLDYIATTNLFNFVIFASIIIYFFFKLDVIGTLEKGKDSVAVTIDNSEKAKTESEEKLQTIEEKMIHLEDEIMNILKSSEDNAEIVGDKILKDAEKLTANIKENAVKLVENKTITMKNDILKRASLASVETAKKHIINELNVNAELHDRLIDESIEALNNVGRAD